MTHQPDYPEKRRRVWWLTLFWLCAWLGTSVGGAVFGTFGGPVGMVFGFAIAAIVGGPIHLGMLLVTVVGPLVRFRYAAAVMAGALTGIFSVGAADMDTPISMSLAGLIGGLGSYFFLRWCLKKPPLVSVRDRILPLDNQFSLRDTFVFLTIVVGIVALIVRVMAARGH